MFVTIKLVKTEEDYDEALRKIDELIKKNDKRTEQEEAELEVISDLVWIYEEENYPIDSPADPIEAIKFWMEQKNLKQADLISYIGQRSHVSEILSGKRKLTVKMIKALHEGLGIPYESLIS